MTSQAAKPQYPSNPRILPDLSGVICDQCGRKWNPGKGEQPCCIECAVAWVKIESAGASASD